MPVPPFFPRRLAGTAMLKRSHPAAVLLGALCVSGLVAASVATAQRPAAPTGLAAGGQLWISATPIDNTRQLLIVIDPAAKNAAVYHVDAATGTLALKSTRDISWDLLVGDFNAQEPKPAALRKMLEIGRGPQPEGQGRP
ncbi:MAG: hypothetical protein EBZ59_11740 [Planctomycetia bacterium]|nr:hypothetical protein [Planctomycetia bacterium]